jgi:hypothetical protein
MAEIPEARHATIAAIGLEELQYVGSTGESK